MRVLVSGSSGLVGSALLPALAVAGHAPIRLVRGVPPGRLDVPWNPESPRAPEILRDSLERARPEAVVHLAGAPIASGRWTERRRHTIRESRVRDTRVLSDTLATLAQRPRVLLSASAIGLYGDRGEEVLTEASGPGRGFLADVGREWEAATAAASAAGIRVVHMRIGMVLARQGGALRMMLPFFKLGLGGPLGDGRQYVSWISLEDLVAALLFVLSRGEMAGAVNAVSPFPVPQAEFARALGRVLHRPAVLPAPAWGLRLLFPGMADELLLSSTRVVPARLREAGFAHRHSVLEDALRDLLARP